MLTLKQFLTDHTILAVELLPDNRLINIVLNSTILYGVAVDNIPVNVTVTRVNATHSDDMIVCNTGVQFSTPDYTMLHGMSELM